VKNYLIHYCSSLLFPESSVIATNTTSVMLENLAENTNYFVRVLAELSGGGPPGRFLLSWDHSFTLKTLYNFYTKIDTLQGNTQVP